MAEFLIATLIFGPISGQRPTPLKMEWKTGVIHLAHTPNSLQPSPSIPGPTSRNLEGELEKEEFVRIILIHHIWKTFAGVCGNERLSWSREIVKDEWMI